jgi:hypothetical protein
MRSAASVSDRQKIAFSDICHRYSDQRVGIPARRAKVLRLVRVAAWFAQFLRSFLYSRPMTGGRHYARTQGLVVGQFK